MVQRLFFYTSKTGLGFQLIFKADRPASYGRRGSVSHLLVSSWRILWSELHDPAFGNGRRRGVGGRRAGQQRAYALRCLSENKHVLLAWVICDRTAKRPVTIVDRGTEEKATDLRKPLCSPRQLYISC